jgi:hypothetical protein
MKKITHGQGIKKPQSMFELEVGSMEDLKTHEDFNNEHPIELDELALKQGNSDRDKNNSTKKLKPKTK